MPGGFLPPRVRGPAPEPTIDMEDWKRRQAEAKSPQAIAIRKASHLLSARDYVVVKSMEGRRLHPDWLAWREQLREVVRGNSLDIPPEPERWADAEYIDLSERPVEESPIPPPPSPAVVALEKMEALKARVDGARVHPEVAALLTEGETPPDAIERLTPDEDALLDLGASLSEEALEEALRFIPRSAREKWMEGLHGTHADLRLKRGTDKENLHREAQVTRMMTLLGRVGEKR